MRIRASKLRERQHHSGSTLFRRLAAPPMQRLRPRRPSLTPRASPLSEAGQPMVVQFRTFVDGRLEKCAPRRESLAPICRQGWSSLPGRTSDPPPAVHQDNAASFPAEEPLLREKDIAAHRRLITNEYVVAPRLRSLTPGLFCVALCWVRGRSAQPTRRGSATSTRSTTWCHCKSPGQPSGALPQAPCG